VCVCLCVSVCLCVCVCVCEPGKNSRGMKLKVNNELSFTSSPATQFMGNKHNNNYYLHSGNTGIRYGYEN
jgi:hypothetical protein